MESLGVKGLCIWVFLAGAVLLAQSATEIAKVKGRVLTENGDAVSDASVYFELLDRPATGRPTIVKTDLSGNYEISLREEGLYAVHAFKAEAGYPDVTFAFNLAPGQVVPRVNIKKGQSLRGVDVRLGPKSGTLHIRVIDQETHVPLNVADYKACQVRSPQYCINSRAPGEYDLVVPPTDVSIQISSPGYTQTKYIEDKRKFIRIKPGEERDLWIALAASK
jgi:hypothetical protein